LSRCDNADAADADVVKRFSTVYAAPAAQYYLWLSRYRRDPGASQGLEHDRVFLLRRPDGFQATVTNDCVNAAHGVRYQTTSAIARRTLSGGPYVEMQPPLIGSPSRPFTTPVGAALGRCRRISGSVLDCCDLVPAMDDFPCGVPALADRIRDDRVVPVTMPRFIGCVENASEHAPVSQRNAHGFAEIGFNLLIGHALEIA
jgi:hypothetical protein